jgi:hypothetical protein
MDKGRVGEDRGSKEMDGYPLTQTSFRNRTAMPSVLMVVCVGMKCACLVRLLTMHIIAS